MFKIYLQNLFEMPPLPSPALPKLVPSLVHVDHYNIATVSKRSVCPCPFHPTDECQQSSPISSPTAQKSSNSFPLHTESFQFLEKFYKLWSLLRFCSWLVLPSFCLTFFQDSWLPCYFKHTVFGWRVSKLQRKGTVNKYWILGSRCLLLWSWLSKYGTTPCDVRVLSY